jgi:hypothetical protein
LEHLEEDEVRVPEIRNDLYQDAGKILTENELILIVTEAVYSDSVENGKVLMQEPLPGRVVKKQDLVEVTISKGAEVAADEGIMPNLIFLSPDDAGSILIESGITYDIVYEENNVILGNAIMRQQPKPGEKVEEDSVAVITVSGGGERQRILLGWSEWIEELPPGISGSEEYSVQTRTEYRSRDRETKTIDSEVAPAGWKLMEKVRNGRHLSEWSGYMTLEESMNSALYQTLTPTCQSGFPDLYANYPPGASLSWQGWVADYAYKYYRWTEWTEWSDIPELQEEDDANHEVETRKLFMYRKLS